MQKKVLAAATIAALLSVALPAFAKSNNTTKNHNNDNNTTVTVSTMNFSNLISSTNSLSATGGNDASGGKHGDSSVKSGNAGSETTSVNVVGTTINFLHI